MEPAPPTPQAARDGRRRPGPRLATALGLLALLDLVVIAGILLREPLPPAPEFDVAREFAAALVDGLDGERRSGYARARDLMGEDLRAEVDLEDLEARFEDRVARMGFLEEAVLDAERTQGTSAVRSVCFELRYAGLRGTSETARLELVVHRTPEGPRITAFRFLD